MIKASRVGNSVPETEGSHGSGMMIWSVHCLRNSAGGFYTHRVSVTNLPDKKFDGDACNIYLILDKELHAHYQKLEPHLSIIDLRKPWSVSNAVSLASPQLATLCNWLHRTD